MSVMNFRTVVGPTISRVAEVLRSDSEGLHGLFLVSQTFPVDSMTGIVLNGA